MSDPSLALQALIRARLAADAATIALVPAGSILDRSHRPEQFPSIIIGEGQAIFGDNIQDSYHDTVFANLHVWAKEDGLTTGKQIAGAVKAALATGPWCVEGYRAINVRTVNARYMRDPETWATFVTLRAKKIEGIARDTEHSGTAVTDRTLKFESYFVDGITLEHRAVYECGNYQIKSLSEIGRRKGLEIVIEKLGP